MQPRWQVHVICESRLHHIGTRPAIEGPSRVLVFAVLPGKEFDGPVEQVARGALDHDTVERPAGGLHRVAAPDLGGEPASRGALIVKAGGAVEGPHFGFLFDLIAGCLGAHGGHRPHTPPFRWAVPDDGHATSTSTIVRAN